MDTREAKLERVRKLLTSAAGANDNTVKAEATRRDDMVEQIYRFVGTYDLSRRVSFYNRMATCFE
ncbi:protein of unknown function [Magnetospirillum sp. XM-1]|nr:protein of unknown function [Magnetospirillum sp. XM-1]